MPFRYRRRIDASTAVESCPNPKLRRLFDIGVTHDSTAAPVSPPAQLTLIKAGAPSETYPIEQVLIPDGKEF